VPRKAEPVKNSGQQVAERQMPNDFGTILAMRFFIRFLLVKSRIRPQNAAEI